MTSSTPQSQVKNKYINEKIVNKRFTRFKKREKKVTLRNVIFIHHSGNG